MFAAAELHCPSDGTRSHCLMTEAHVCEQFARNCYTKVEWPRVITSWLQVHCPNHCTR